MLNTTFVRSIPRLCLQRVHRALWLKFQVLKGKLLLIHSTEYHNYYDCFTNVKLYLKNLKQCMIKGDNVWTEGDKGDNNGQKRIGGEEYCTSAGIL